MDGKEIVDPKPNTGAEAAGPVEEPFVPGTESSAEIADLREKAGKAQQYYEQLLRVTADLDNYKKRAARERQEAIKFANESLLERLLPILDNFEMALNAAGGAQPSLQSIQAGVGMILQQFKGAVAEAGLQEIDASGQRFDPNLHEAISQQETSEVPEGHVVQQVRKGYKLRDRLLRPASVVVAKKPAA